MKFINENGAVEEFIYDESSGKLVHNIKNDITNLIDQNKREFNSSDKKYKKPMEKVARIDGYAAYNWCMRYGIKYEDFLRDTSIVYKFLADPANACFKTKNAKLKGH